MSSRQAKLQFEAECKVLLEIHANPETTQRHLSEKVGISLGAINYCLAALVDKGLLKVQNSMTPLRAPGPPPDRCLRHAVYTPVLSCQTVKSSS